jgi:hypothetical protein
LKERRRALARSPFFPAVRRRMQYHAKQARMLRSYLLRVDGSAKSTA